MQVEISLRLKEDLKQILQVTSQLQPFVQSIACAVQVANPKRCHPPDPAPMEQICHQIQKVDPDSKSRVDAIEKEEKNRKAVLELRRKDYANTLVSLKKQLKAPKDAGRKRLSVGTSSTGVTVVGRDRSRHGRDPGMLSPTSGASKRSSWAGMPRGSLSPRTDGISPSLTDQSSLDESFEHLESLARSELPKTARATTASVTKCLEFSAELDPELKCLSLSLPEAGNWVEKAGQGKADLTEVRESRSESSPEPRDLERLQNQPTIVEPKKIPKPPMLPPNLMGSVPQSTLDAREKVLASLKEKVPRVDIGVSNSPVREIPQVEE